ncbi:MAG: DUF4331 domain-containing protein [Myxococcota bacterium]
MFNRTRSAALLALTLSTFSSLTHASSHREAPAMLEDPAADLTDVYAWVEGSNLIVVANTMGMEAPEGGPNWANFSDDILYEVHITGGGNTLLDRLTYQFRFTTSPVPYVDPGNLQVPPGGGKEFFSQLAGVLQTYTVTKLTNGENPVVVATGARVPPPNVGARTNNLVNAIPPGQTYEQFFVDNAGTSRIHDLSGGGRVFAGPRDDPFFVDLGATMDLAGLRTIIGGNPRDSLAHTNVHSLVLEIPLTEANGGTAVVPGTSNAQTVGVWASTSRRKVTIRRRDGKPEHTGPWVQVSRLGFPLVNEVFIGLQDKDRYNQLSPLTDVANFAAYWLSPILVRDAELLGFYAPGGPLAGCGDINLLKSNRVDILDVMTLNGALGHTLTSYGDVLRIDLGTASAFPNGRKLTDDVVDIGLSLILCRLQATIPDGVNSNETAFRSTFPFLAAPWEGFSASARPGAAP